MSHFNQWAKKKPHDAPSCIFPGITAGPKWQKFIRDELYPKIAEFCDTTQAKDYSMNDPSPLLTVPGYTMDPWPLPNQDPSHADFRYDDDFVFCMKAVIKALFPGPDVRTDLCTHPFALRKPASSGHPEDTTDVAEKLQIVRRSIRNFEKALDIIAKDDVDWHGLQDLGYYFVIEVKRRFQPERCIHVDLDPFYRIKGVPEVKERTATLLDGTVVKCDRTFGLERGLHNMRVREVNAVPLAINVPIKVLNDSLNAVEFKYAPDCTHASNFRDWIKLNGSRIVGMVGVSADVASLDTIINASLLDLEIECLAEEIGLSPRFVKWIRAALYSPWICNGIFHQKDEDLPYMSPYEPLAVALRLVAQLISGIGITTNCGRIAVKSGDAAALVKMKWLPRDTDAIVAYVRWEYQKLRLYNHNQSDDMFWWMEPSMVKTFVDEYPKRIKEAYSGFNVTIDAFASYLSNVVKMTLEGWRGFPDLLRGVVKDLVPEVSRPVWWRTVQATINIESIRRMYGFEGRASREFMQTSTKFKAFGLRSKIEMYKKDHPLASDLYEMIFDLFEFFSPGSVAHFNALADAEQDMLESMAVDPHNLADLEVMTEPEKLFFKYTQDDISDGVFHVNFVSIDPSELQPLRELILE